MAISSIRFGDNMLGGSTSEIFTEENKKMSGAGVTGNIFPGGFPPTDADACRANQARSAMGIPTEAYR